MTETAVQTNQNQSKSQIFSIADYGRIVRALPKSVISLAEKILLLALADHFGKNGKIYPSNEKLENETALASKTILNCLSSLKKKKLINYPRQYNKNRRYIQLFDPESKALLVPQLSLVGDSTIPGGGYSINKNVPGERIKEQQQTSKKPKPKRPEKKRVVVPLFDPKIEKILSEYSHFKIDRTWIKNSFEKYKDKQTVQNILSIFDESKNKDNPTGFIRAALDRGWVFDSKKQQSLNGFSSGLGKPVKPRKYTAIEEQVIKFLRSLSLEVMKNYAGMDTEEITQTKEFKEFYETKD